MTVPDPVLGAEATYRVRFDEAAPDGRLRTSGLLRYAQDLAWLHSAAQGFGRDWYTEHGVTWLVRTARVDVLGPIPVGVTIVGATRVAGFRRVWSRRTSTFRTEGSDGAGGGAPVARVDIDWVLVDGRGMPTRIPVDIEARFAAPGSPALQLGRVDLPEPPRDATALRTVVRPHELDPMAHANNAVYADWLDEAVIAAGGGADVGAFPRQVRLEYVAAAGPDVALEAVAWRHDDGWAFRLRGPDDAELLRASLRATIPDTVR